MSLSLDTIRECLEGAVPTLVATCSVDGTPNVSYVSQVHYVDPGHVALSFQFFNKTRENVLAHPQVTLLTIHPATAAIYELRAEYLRTETAGPLFEGMKAKLAGIASHTGMAGVFRLRGSDVYRVVGIRRIPGGELNMPLPQRNLLAAVRRAGTALLAAVDLADLLERVLVVLREAFGVDHAMVLLAEEDGCGLYTVASHGYATSGVGSEIPLGHGVIGVAARERTAIRINYSTADYDYGRAVRASLAGGGGAGELLTEIPFPGLAEPGSQLAVPVLHGERLLGVLYVESPAAGRFGYDDEDALVALAAQVATAMRLAEVAGEHVAESGGTPRVRSPQQGAVLTVRHFAANNSVFLDDEYLIKGVAGAIFWKLARDFVQAGRTEFSNRELRVDPAIPLPELSGNLEARLILLQRRLAERGGALRIEKTGRGRFRLVVGRPLSLVEVPAGT